MVIYDLICEHGHEFEGWFKNGEDMASQQMSGMVTCPYCDSDSVSKKLTAPNLGRKSNSSVSNTGQESVSVGSASSAKAYAHLQKMLTEVHDFVENNFEDVGNRFAEEAISMHHGEKEAANIRGVVSKEQMTELAEEGVQAMPLPAKPVEKKKLN